MVKSGRLKAHIRAPEFPNPWETDVLEGRVCWIGRLKLLDYAVELFFYEDALYQQQNDRVNQIVQEEDI